EEEEEAAAAVQVNCKQNPNAYASEVIRRINEAFPDVVETYQQLSLTQAVDKHGKLDFYPDGSIKHTVLYSFTVQRPTTYTFLVSHNSDLHSTAPQIVAHGICDAWAYGVRYGGYVAKYDAELSRTRRGEILRCRIHRMHLSGSGFHQSVSLQSGRVLPDHWTVAIEFKHPRPNGGQPFYEHLDNDPKFNAWMPRAHPGRAIPPSDRLQDLLNRTGAV
ncbi:hypothetical protein CALCODRAFT_489050, partial [Calocera cornea HHB12733]